MYRRTFFGTAAVASMAGILAACGSNPGTSSGTAASGTDAEVAITLAGWSLKDTPEFQTLADAFNAAHPNITVTVKEYDATNYDTQMIADLAAGTAPDLFPLKNQRTFYTYASGKQLVDVSDIAKKLGDHASIEANSLDGTAYAIPYRQDAMVLYYNKDLFDAAGVPTPDGTWTWETYVEVAKELTEALAAKASDAKGVYQHAWQSFVQGFATAQSPKASILTGEYDYMAPFYERALDLQETGAMESYGTITTNKLTYQTQFGTQKAAMMLMGTWYAGMLVTQQADGAADDFTWGIAPAPQRDASTAGLDEVPITFGDATAVGINASVTGDKLAAAKAFVEFAASEEAGKALTGIGITPFALTDANVTNFFATDGMPTDELSTWAYSTRETKPDNPVSEHTAAIQNLLLDMHTAVMSGSEELGAALEAASTKATTEVLG